MFSHDGFAIEQLQLSPVVSLTSLFTQAVSGDHTKLIEMLFAKQDQQIVFAALLIHRKKFYSEHKHSCL